jgi:alanine dehydrogenase
MPGKVAVIGGGVVGFNATQVAVGMGADVTVRDRNPEVLERLAELLNVHAGRVTCEAVARELGYEYTPVNELLD